MEEMTQVYHVGGMSCGGCATAVKNKLSALRDVTSVSIDLDKNEAKITSSKLIGTNALEEALKDTAYTLSAIK